MKTPPRPLPTWLKWLFRVLGVLLIFGTWQESLKVLFYFYALRRGWSGPDALPSNKIEELVGDLVMTLLAVLAFWAVGIWLIRRSFKGKVPSESDDATVTAAETPKPLVQSSPPTVRGGWSSCNVLATGKDARRLWHFSGRSYALQHEENKLPSETLPAKLITKDWQTLYQPKLNVAWLAADKAFLRVVQLPPADTFEETASMVELQLEKVSPLPVAQIVWTFELLPKRPGELQTAIVVIMGRNLVEEFLGKLEAESYLADRLEVPFIDQLLATKVDGDGVWIYPGVGVDENNCVVAWWYGGVLQSVSLLHLPPAEERGPFLREQIAQMAWAGELEGWITSPPRRFLIATPENAAAWQPMLQEGTEQHVEVVAPLPDSEIAKRTARRASREKVPATLVPPEFTARYRQQFVDRIWMRSVFAVALLYLFGVFIYLAWVQYVDFRVSKVEVEARTLAGTYTNALRLKDQVRVMQDQLNLQFAGLECYKAVAQQIPEGITLESMNFQKGKTLFINGLAPRDSITKINEFSDLLRRTISNGQPLFKSVTVPQQNTRADQISWSFTAELAKGESE